ncbi:uncharacterized protein LOC62_01G001626 [Vanrija pseudolonga]|uniref:Uncharacterized protein n=1 Tax=Vanrija pseudolonga TaxID=143232 RepID=A0AAF1BNG5_9TREE|nr:hypothetical protein LOC62_01G001626 [Vanrija pseudolonga]
MCLRVNKTFHKIAGPILYHTVRVDRHNMKKFFLGAFVGTNIDEEELECGLMQGKECTPPTNERWDAEVGPKLLPTPPQEKQVEGAASDRPNVTNFKAALLGHVRVLSLGSHHCCVCHFYGTNIGPLLKNLDTLRVVPAPLTPFTVDTVCDNRIYCPFFDSLRPRKLVFRNVGGRPVFLTREHHNIWNPSRLEEVVYILPTDGRVYRNETVKALDELIRFDVPCKVVFCRGWEVWGALGDHALSLVTVNSAVQHVPVRPVDFIAAFLNTVEGTAFGLESVDFHIGGPLTGGECQITRAFQLENPDEPITSERLRQLVKDELSSRAMEALCEDEPLDYKSLSQYHQLSAEVRRFELDDSLDSHLMVASLQSQEFFNVSALPNEGYKEMKNLVKTLGDTGLLDPSVIEEFHSRIPFTASTCRWVICRLAHHLEARLQPPSDSESD